MSTVYEVIGLGIGEETKGAWVEFLAHHTNAQSVWRKGGPQSGHHLVLSDGRSVELSHFGAGVFVGLPTYIDMPIIPALLFEEALELEELGVHDPLSLISVHAGCLVVTPFHQAISRLREILRPRKKGTIGLGVGEAMSDSQLYPNLAIYAHDLPRLSEDELSQKILAIRDFYQNKADELTRDLPDISPDARIEIDHLHNDKLIREIAESYKLLSELITIRREDYLSILLQEDTIIEPSHGAQLHPRYGYLPHVTQIDPVAQDALQRLQKHNHRGEVRRFGVFRSYSTRFGAGPFVAYDESVTAREHEVHNTDCDWLGKFRMGNLDLVGLAYGIKICGEPSLSGLMISFFDSLTGKDSWNVCTAYRFLGKCDDLDEYFDIQNDLIVGIKFHQDDGTDTQLKRQHRLTELLFQCEPVCETIFPQEGLSLQQSFVKFIEKKLSLPVVAVAFGPRPDDRYLVAGYEHLFI